MNGGSSLLDVLIFHQRALLRDLEALRAGPEALDFVIEPVFEPEPAPDSVHEPEPVQAPEPINESVSVQVHEPSNESVSVHSDDDEPASLDLEYDSGSAPSSAEEPLSPVPACRFVPDPNRPGKRAYDHDDSLEGSGSISLFGSEGDDGEQDSFIAASGDEESKGKHEADDSLDLLSLRAMMRVWQKRGHDAALEVPWFRRAFDARLEIVRNGIKSRAYDKLVRHCLVRELADPTICGRTKTPVKQRCALCTQQKPCRHYLVLGPKRYPMASMCGALARGLIDFFTQLCVLSTRDPMVLGEGDVATLQQLLREVVQKHSDKQLVK